MCQHGVGGGNYAFFHNRLTNQPPIQGSVLELVKKFPVLYETQNSFPCSQELATGPCLEPDQSNSHTRIQSGPFSSGSLPVPCLSVLPQFMPYAWMNNDGWRVRMVLLQTETFSWCMDCPVLPVTSANACSNPYYPLLAQCSPSPHLHRPWN